MAKRLQMKPRKRMTLQDLHNDPSARLGHQREVYKIETRLDDYFGRIGELLEEAPPGSAGIRGSRCAG